MAQAEGLRWRGDWETIVLVSLRTTTLARRALGSMTLKKRKNSVSSIWCGMKKDGVNELEVDRAYLLVVFSQSERFSGSGSMHEGVGRRSDARRERC
jgi:hypothetical protein